MDTSVFLDKTMRWRKELGKGDFVSRVSETDKFNIMVNIVHDNTTEWATAVGLIKTKKKDDEPISSQEQMVKEYFGSHSFVDPEMARNFADLITLLLPGIQASKYIRISKKAMRTGFFPRYVCIVPTGNNNGHNYTVGVPVINYKDGVNFVKENGELGNNMETQLSALRVPSKEEVSSALANMLYVSSSMCEHLVINLLMS